MLYRAGLILIAGVLMGMATLLFLKLRPGQKTKDILDTGANAGAPERTFDPAHAAPGTICSHEEQVAWQQHFNGLAPKPGEEAPEIELFDIAGKEIFRLSEFRNQQPVGLIFGSFT